MKPLQPTGMTSSYTGSWIQKSARANWLLVFFATLFALLLAEIAVRTAGFVLNRRPIVSSDVRAGWGAWPNLHVRREKALFHSGWKSHPGTGSLRPVATRAAVEVMKLSKPLV